MKFVEQTSNTCLEACIASLTGIPLEDFPELNDKKENSSGDFWTTLNNWLIDNHKVYVETVRFEDFNFYRRGIVIAIGYTSRSTDVLHAVLWNFDNKKMIFDPMPGGNGLVDNPKSFAILVNYYAA